MGAIPTSVLEEMDKSLGVLFDRMLCLIPEFQATHEECIELLAPKEHHEILFKAAEFADVDSSEGWMYHIKIPGAIDGIEVPQFQILMRTHAGKSPPLKPRAPRWQSGAKLGPRVIDWMTKRYECGRIAASAGWVLNELSRKCTTGAQIRFLWPCVMHLTIRKNYTDSPAGISLERWAQKHSEYKAQKSVPALSQELRKVMRETSNWITSAALIGDDIRQGPLGFVEMSSCGWTHFPIGDGTETVIRK